MKSVMLSIRPKWCENIANGEKTIEVRKTKPKLDTPFKCYIYCTLQGCNEFFRVDLGRDVAKWNRGKWADRKGNVIGEFICDRIYELAPLNHAPDDVEKQACLTREEIVNYLKGTGYGWHISDLRIYDAPRELSEFQRATDPCDSCHAEYTWECTDCKKLGGDIKRPPQSWCYVEAMKDAK
jgi:predicted transcriptional regulator|nr:MAG TPA: helix-turn-helix domain-containing protein [Caudoviricetes sp.]